MYCCIVLHLISQIYVRNTSVESIQYLGWNIVHKFVLLKTPSKKIKHHREEVQTHRAEPWLIGLLWSGEKANPFTASELLGQLSPLQCNKMTVKYPSCASDVLACVWQPLWEKPCECVYIAFAAKLSQSVSHACHDCVFFYQNEDCLCHLVRL